MLIGLCAERTTNPASLVCTATSGISVEEMQSRLQFVSSTLLDLALTIQTRVFKCTLAASGVMFYIAVALITASVLVHSKKVSLASWLRYIALALLWAANTLSFAAALGTLQTVEALRVEGAMQSENVVRVIAGRPAMVLHWMIFGLAVVFTPGMMCSLHK